MWKEGNIVTIKGFQYNHVYILRKCKCENDRIRSKVQRQTYLGARTKLPEDLYLEAICFRDKKKPKPSGK